MFKPRYLLTPKLIATIGRIERQYGQLEALRIPKKLELSLERENLIQSSYISNSIEGNPLSKQEVTNLLLNDRIPTNRDEKEVKNYFEILKHLHQYLNNEITPNLITTIHAALMRGVNDKIAGAIRSSRVVVGRHAEHKGKITAAVKHEPPAHTKSAIEELLNQLTNWYVQNKETPTILKIGAFHHEFVYIHPFEDGNGRVGRLLTALLFLKAGYAINRYFVLDDYYDIDRLLYSDMLHTADKGDKTKWLEYFTDGVFYSLQSSLSRIQTQLDQLSIEEQPSPREKEVLKILQERKEITSAFLSGLLSISRQQAHNLLSNLVEKGFLNKQGSTKSSYYVLK